MKTHGRDRCKRMSCLTVPLIGALLCLGACSSTFQAGSAETSGFLGDYSMMQQGKNDEALLVYVDPQADLSAYRKILMDPVKVYASKDGDLGELARDDLQRIVDYLAAALREQLGADWTLVDAKGPDVLRLRVAITEAEASNVVMDTVSSVMPIGLAVSSIKQLTTGSHAAVGRAGIEAEIQDSQTGKRLLAAVDRRIGRKYTGKFDKLDEWHAVQDAFDYWAVRIKERLAELRDGSGS